MRPHFGQTPFNIQLFASQFASLAVFLAPFNEILKQNNHEWLIFMCDHVEFVAY